MAYREFYKRQDIVVPDYTPIAQGLSNLFTGLEKSRERDLNRAQQFKFDVKGGWSKDQDIINERASQIVGRALQNRGRVDSETRKMMAEVSGFGRISEIQRKEADDLMKVIDDLGKNNVYFDTAPASQLLISAGDYDATTRPNVFAKVKQELSNPRNFKKDQYLANYVKDRQRSYIEKTTGTPNSKTSIYNQSTFWTPEGKPGVTDDHAIDLIKSNSMLDALYTDDVTNQLSSEIQKIKGSGDERAAWMKGKKDADIMNELINDPSKNTLNQKSIGERKRELAKRDLEKFNAIDRKTSTEYKPSGSGGDGPIKNDSIGHSETFMNNRISTEGVSDPVANAFGIQSVSGPGGVLLIKKGISAGRPITMEADSQNSFDYRTGKTGRRLRGKFNLTGYQLLPYTKDGKLYPIQANSFGELMTAISNLPDTVISNLQPELRVGLTGYSVDDSKMLGDIASKTFEISEAIGETSDPDKKAELENQLFQLNQLKNSFNLEGIYDEDIINGAQKSGIKQVRKDQILMADKSDLDKLKTITDGLDLNDQKNWSADMRALNDAFKKRVSEVGATTKPTSKKYPLPAGQAMVVRQGDFEYVWDENQGKYVPR